MIGKVAGFARQSDGSGPAAMPAGWLRYGVPRAGFV